MQLSDNQLVIYLPLGKIKNLLSNNSSDVMSAVIDKIERDIKKCEQRK